MKKYIASAAETVAAMAHRATVARATSASSGFSNQPGYRRLTSAAVIAAVVALVGAVATATPASGVSATVVARAAFADHVDLKLTVREGHRGRDKDTIDVRDAADTVMQQIQFGPGAITGWHSHPGPAVILIKSGQLTFYSEEDRNCNGRTLSAGQAFIEPPGLVHFAQNPSLTTITEVAVTYLDVPTGLASPRIDEAAPGHCPF